MTDRLRNAFHPLIKMERHTWAGKLLVSVLIISIVVNGLYVLVHSLRGDAVLGLSNMVNIVLFFVQIVLLIPARMGYTREVSFVLSILVWGGMTYNAWRGMGVHDSSIIVYLLVILAGALVMGWQFVVSMTVLSVASIWGLALAETLGIRISQAQTPLVTAWELSVVFLFAIALVYMVMSVMRQSARDVEKIEEQFSKIFSVSPMAISVIALQPGKLLDANDAYWKLMGLDAQTSLGKLVTELNLWVDEKSHKRFVDAMLKQRSLHLPVFEFINAKGEKRVTAVFHELIDSASEPTVLSIFYDITEQVNSQRALQASEEKYKNFVETSAEGIWFLAFDEPIPTDLPEEEQVRLIYRFAYVQDCNETFARMYGYASRDAALGVRLLDLHGGSVTDVNFQATLGLVHANYRASERETVEKTVDGRTIHFLNSAVGVFKDKNLIGIWGTQLDVTTLQQTQIALQRSEARLRALLEATPDMIFEFDRDGRILQFISSSTMNTLLPPEQFLGRNISEIMPLNVVEQTMFAISRTLETGHLQVFEYQLLEMNDPRYYEASVIRNDVDTVIAMVRDVTVRNWTMNEREKLIDELEAKNAELEQFTYTVSHDLKSPLITIKGFMGFVQEDARAGNIDRLGVDIQRITDATDKMQKLLSDLLELSRVGRLVNKLELVNMNELAEETVELIHGRITQANVQVRIQPNLSFVYADRQRVFEVLQNLVDNAAKFMGDQSNPLIEIGQKDQLNGMPLFYVKDNGAGISPQFKDKIFGLFNKLDSRSDGTGIGLALVKRIIEYHKGTIWVESQLGQGATFFFTLPSPPMSGEVIE
ncbi:MAG: PAS domain S-box protein [Anaerolineales bacterium]|nr:PAS domain S-box protein [Anaerolineales bacterium]